MKIRWNGQNETLVRVKPMEEKITMAKGDVVEVEDQRGKELLAYSKDFQAVTADIKPEKVAKADVKSEMPLKKISNKSKK
jgi:hypothetical protein